MRLHPNSFGLTWCGGANVSLWSLTLQSLQVLCIKRYNRKQRPLCKANSARTCFPIAQRKGTEISFSSCFSQFYISERKIQGSRYFSLIRERNGSFWLLHLTTCRVKAGLKRVSVPFAQKSLQIFVVLISMLKQWDSI